MIHHVVQFALRQRLLVLLLVAFIAVGGAISFQHMPVDAYPDLSPPMVEVITQWPGHAAEEIERLVTVPTEVEMNGVPKMAVMRSISLYGLSDVIMTFDEGTDDYFARQVVFQRLSEVTYPTGVTPTLAPLASPSGLVYRYVIESPDRTPQELKVYEDWVIERQYKQVPGVADDSGFGGTVMQYQVLLDPARLYAYHITVPTVLSSFPSTIPMPAADSIRKAANSTMFAASGWSATPRTSATSSSARKMGCRCVSATSAKLPSETPRDWANLDLTRKMMPSRASS